MNVSIMTVSSSRYKKASQGMPIDDESGSKAFEMIKESGHNVVSRKLVGNDRDMIRLE
ncbi:MAG: molybdenum cofactor biosynthesis protein, partial [Nitrososphaerales archaeon]|nr:molybdenum cofactor biosynthesis protein [Nitrososphaerales archaeon]